MEDTLASVSATGVAEFITNSQDLNSERFFAAVVQCALYIALSQVMGLAG